MFDFSWSEVALIIIVALIFIGPKDLPIAIRGVSRAFKSMRRMASEFQAHVDDLIKDADLGDAKVHLRDLTPSALRNRFMDTLDADRSLRDTLNVVPPPSLSARYKPSQMFQPQETARSDTLPITAAQQVQERHSAPRTRSSAAQDANLPHILPPSAAQRIARECRQFQAPRYVPPVRVVHHGRRVGLTRHAEAAKSGPTGRTSNE